MAAAPSKKNSPGLKKKHLEALQKHRKYLIETLDVKTLVDGILDNNMNVLNKEQLNCIVRNLSEQSPRRVLETFLDFLEGVEESNYKQFKALLRKVGYAKVAEKLTTSKLKGIFRPTNEKKDNKKNVKTENERLAKAVASLQADKKCLLDKIKEREANAYSGQDPEVRFRHAQRKSEEEVEYEQEVGSGHAQCQREEQNAFEKSDEVNVNVLQPREKGRGLCSRFLDSMAKACACYCCVKVDYRALN